MSFPSTTTTAWPERQISPVSRFPVEKDSADFDEFSRMRPYARWRMELFSGVMETCRPACALVLRKTIFSTAACCCGVMETPSSEQLMRFKRRDTLIRARFIANYKNCPPWSQTVKTEIPIQRDSANSGTELQVFAVVSLSYTLWDTRLYQLCIVPSSLRLIGKYARR